MGLARSVGVSNYQLHHLLELKHEKVQPAINQVEVNPWHPLPEELLGYCRERRIVIEAWAPLGAAQLLGDVELRRVVAAVNEGRGDAVSAAQVLLRWSVQKGFVPLVTSTSEEHQSSDLRIFDFSLSEAQIAQLDALSTRHHNSLGKDLSDVP